MLEKYLENEIIFNIENIINDISNWQNDYDKTEAIENLTKDDIKIICNKMLNSTCFITELNEFMNGNIESEIYHYVKNNKGGE